MVAYGVGSRYQGTRGRPGMPLSLVFGKEQLLWRTPRTLLVRRDPQLLTLLCSVAGMHPAHICLSCGFSEHITTRSARPGRSGRAMEMAPCKQV